ncbi:hypothetical protein OTC26_024580 [Streptomyces tirandamycinicus]|uniref:hypothetical protein n=1 Tax=Streptomyces tirandamycinicus TaxID=2174846 RepID=UPI00226E39A8|nr:hypothetical protein [Streptomyces tirandamycinicus]MCY0983263.1 hypothetical protein [Streptomyces tirandamycinicus]
MMELMPPHDGAGSRVDWTVAAAECRVPGFPSDYQGFVAAYGEGEISQNISALVPQSAASVPAYVDRLPEDTVIAPEMQRWQRPELAAVHRLEDMVRWGGTAAADALCWVASGLDPEKWPVAVWARHGGGWEVYDCGMVEFLLKVFRADFPECPISDLSLWGNSAPRFLHMQEEQRIRDTGIDPWTGEPDPWAGVEFD